MNGNIAIVHEWLTTIAGSEKVLEAIYEIYPAPIYTLVADKDSIKDTLLENAKIITSFIQNLPWAKKRYRMYLPLFPLAIEQFDLSHYNVIISSNTCVAKGILTNSKQLHICYCHTPIRYAWDMYYQYLKEEGLTKGIKGLIAKIILHYMRIWDVTTVNRVDFFIANSKYVARRIKRAYRREATVIYPPVDVERFHLHTNKEDYYLIVSRMVPYKKVDVVVKAFTQIKHKKLIVIGDGPDLKKIQKLAGENVKFLGYQPFEIVKKFMERAKAFVFAGEEDFGIVLVEAQACGTPVICYGKGGAPESVIDGKTGIFFNEQNIKGVIDVIRYFEKTKDKFDPKIIRENAQRFSKEKFKEKFKKFVEQKLNEYTI